MIVLFYYKNTQGEYTERSFPLQLDGETEVTESEYNAYIESENKKHEME